MTFQGTYTALVTPFNRDESIDVGALEELVEFQIREGISGLVPMGTTGESPTLSHEEHNRVIELVITQAAGRVPVIAGTGSNSTAEAIRMTRRAKENGATASLQVAPYYNKPSAEGLYRHFMTIADSVDLPLIIYNIPGRTAKNIENSTMLKLAQHANIIGVKEASGSIPQIMELIAKAPSDFAVVSGDDTLTLPIIALGGKGVISVASNIIPAQMEELVTAALSGKSERARELHYQLLPLLKALSDTNPIPIKCALHLKGMIEEVYRLPLCPMEEEQRSVLAATLKALELI